MAEYKIQRGDTLSRIAKKYGTTVSALASANNISNPNKIRAGATLKLPGSTQAAAPASAASPSAAVSNPVQSGIPADAQLRAEAESIYNPGYQQAIDALTQNANTISTRYGRTVEDYGDYIDKTLKDTQLAIENSLLKRGMGRSSRAAYEVTTGLADVNQNAQEQYAEWEQDYQDRIAAINTQKQTLAGTKEQNIQSKVLELKQYYETIRQFNEQMALKEKELALAAKSGGSGGGGGKSSVETALEAYLASLQDQPSSKKSTTVNMNFKSKAPYTGAASDSWSGKSYRPGHYSPFY